MGFLITKLISANVMNHSVIVQRTGLVGPQLEIGWRSLTQQAGRDGGGAADSFQDGLRVDFLEISRQSVKSEVLRVHYNKRVDLVCLRVL